MLLWMLWWQPQVPVTTRDIPNAGLLSAQLGNACIKSILTPSSPLSPLGHPFPVPIQRCSLEPLAVKFLLTEGDYFTELS